MVSNPSAYLPITMLEDVEDVVSTVGLTVEIKLRFPDGLVWTVVLTVELFKTLFLNFFGEVWELPYSTPKELSEHAFEYSICCI